MKVIVLQRTRVMNQRWNSLVHIKKGDGPGVHMVFRLSFQNLWLSLYIIQPLVFLFCFYTKLYPRLNISRLNV